MVNWTQHAWPPSLVVDMLWDATLNQHGVGFQWRFYVLSASNVIFRARTYGHITRRKPTTGTQCPTLFRLRSPAQYMWQLSMGLKHTYQYYSNHLFCSPEYLHTYSHSSYPGTAQDSFPSNICHLWRNNVKKLHRILEQEDTIMTLTVSRHCLPFRVHVSKQN